MKGAGRERKNARRYGTAMNESRGKNEIAWGGAQLENGVLRYRRDVSSKRRGSTLDLIAVCNPQVFVRFDRVEIMGMYVLRIKYLAAQHPDPGPGPGPAG